MNPIFSVPARCYGLSQVRHLRQVPDTAVACIPVLARCREHIHQLHLVLAAVLIRLHVRARYRKQIHVQGPRSDLACLSCWKRYRRQGGSFRLIEVNGESDGAFESDVNQLPARQGWFDELPGL